MIEAVDSVLYTSMHFQTEVLPSPVSTNKNNNKTEESILQQSDLNDVFFITSVVTELFFFSVLL